MSGSYLLTADKRSLDSKTHYFFGKEISTTIKALDKIAKKLKVNPLSSFLSADQDDQEAFRDIIDEAGGDTSDFKFEPEQWFDPADGLKTIGALLKHLAKEPKAVKKSAAVIEELTEVEVALAFVAKKQARWHFWIDW